MKEEEQDYETPLKDLESQSGEMDEEIERQRRDTEGVQSEWENRQGDTSTPGAQEQGSLEDRYGTDDEEPKDARGGEDESEDDSGDEPEEDREEDGDSDDEDSTESRGEGATEEDDEN
ncbi:MAG: hypothetical protein WKF31_07945 [Thermoleophilaceae bacterium]